jgi:hypothetical protein
MTAVPECPVCLEPMDVEKHGIARTPCGHEFHAMCFVAWSQRSPTCPICRAELEHHEGGFERYLVLADGLVKIGVIAAVLVYFFLT